MKTIPAMLALALAFGAPASALKAQPAATSAADPFGQTRLDWNKPHRPFNVIGNIYYVGAAGVSAFLIRTPAGAILTDGGLPESAPLIERNIRALGVKLSDIKILLNSHAHFDHAGGLAELKRATGAKLYASAADKPFLESGRITFGPSTVDPFPPVKVDHVVADGETVSLGGVTLTAHLTPGHTPGCTSWTMPVTAAGHTYRVMFFCSISVAGNPLTGSKAYPGIAQDYRSSFAKLRDMEVDVFLAPHGAQFGMDAKLARMKEGSPNPFVDPEEFHHYLAAARKDYDTELASQFAARNRYVHP
jgi:metallo-beta-lactamase class B